MSDAASSFMANDSFAMPKIALAVCVCVFVFVCVCVLKLWPTFGHSRSPAKMSKITLPTSQLYEWIFDRS